MSLKATGWLLSGIGKPLPGVAARLFLRLYSTPPRRKMQGVQLEIMQQATVGNLSVSRYAFDPSPLRLHTYRWGGPGPRVLLVHGWGDTALSFGALIRQLVEAGYEVLAYDAPAHGFSEGRRTNLVQGMHVLDQVIRQLGGDELYAIIGHSVGALSAALTLARGQLSIPKLVLVSPPLAAPDFFQETFEIFRIGPGVQDRAYGLIRKHLRDDVQTMSLRKEIGNVNAGSILLAYDEQDQLVKHAEITAFVGMHLAVLPLRIVGQGHFRIMRNPEVIRGILGFLGAEDQKKMSRSTPEK